MKNTLLFTILILIIVVFAGCQTVDNGQTQNNLTDKSSGQTASGELAENAETEKDSSKESESNDNSDRKNVDPDKSTENVDNKIETIYTDLDEKKCKTVESNEEEAWSVQECPGIAGYKLEVTEGDLRQSINVIAPSGGKYELNFTQNVSSAFSYFGKKAEWRVKKVGGKIQPIGLITRYNASENPDDSEKVTSYLVVTKFDGEFICITDVVKPIKNANEKARELADVAPTKPCLKGNR